MDNNTELRKILEQLKKANELLKQQYLFIKQENETLKYNLATKSNIIVTPDTLSKYLYKLGWNEYILSSNGNRSFHLLTKQDFYHVTVPANINDNDYPEAINKAIETIAIAHYKTKEEVLLELENLNS